ncbi:MAG: S8 family serine peptidase, partial [Cyclobacteriaceae bacterium]
GGGFGPAFKVVDGYDFVNDDDDPMDDESHGTHVAGIVAANGILRGVAPEANLVALKALDMYGWGTDADIIEAIEWSVDPNGDGDFDDALDIVNMSLGGYGDINSPLSLAVEDATQMGVLFVVAAGNSFSNGSVGSPGVTPGALTVGASAYESEIAYFSSKGPVGSTYDIKPDVLAPGVMIESTLPDQDYGNKDGTSMAAPMVAGLAALIKQRHPTWDAKKIKSAICTSSKDLGHEVMSQGSGLVDAMNALETSLLVHPTQLNYGLNQLSQSTWETSDTITIYNPTSESRSINIETNEIGINGVSMSTPVETMNIAAGDSILLPISISINNTIYESPTTPSKSTSGLFKIRTGQQSLAIPWSFISSPRLTIIWDDNQVNRDHNRSFQIFNETTTIHDGEASFDSTRLVADILVPKGTYDMVIFMEDWTKFLLIEDYPLEHGDTIFAKSELARNPVLFDPHDIQDQSIDIFQRSLSMNISHKELYFGTSISFGGPTEQLWFSDFTDKFVIQSSEFAEDRYNPNSDKYQIIYDNIDALREGDTLVLTNSVDQFANVKLEFDPPTDNANMEIILFSGSYYYAEDFGYLSFGSGYGTTITGKDVWRSNLYLNEPKVFKELSFGNSIDVYGTFDSIDYYMRTTNIRNYEGKVGSFETLNPKLSNQIIPSGGTLFFGEGMVHLRNLDSYGMQGEFLLVDRESRSYELYNADNRLVLGTESIDEYYQELNNINEPHLSITRGNHYYSNQKGSFKYSRSFGLYNWSPLDMKGLKLLNTRGEPTGRLEKGEAGSIELALLHYSPISTVRAILTSKDSQNIYNLGLQSSENADQLSKYIFEFDSLESDARFDLSIKALDTNGDSIVFVMGNAVSTFTDPIPRITGQVGFPKIHRKESYQLTLEDITYQDEDTPLEELNLEVLSSANYDLDSLTLTPRDGWVGILEVPIQITDGLYTSDTFNLTIEIYNIIPTILGHQEHNSYRNKLQPISLENIEISDVDGNYPEDYSIWITRTDHYNVINHSIESEHDFIGELEVEILVSDGYDYSDPYNFTITYENYIPEVIVIPSYTSLDAQSVELSIYDFQITDEDDVEHQLIILEGEHYIYNQEAAQIEPEIDYYGNIDIQAQISDSFDSTAVFSILLESVAAPVEPPELEPLGLENTDELSLYPVPSFDRLMINSARGISRFAIYDVSGNIWKQSPTDSSLLLDNIIDISILSTGTYIIEFEIDKDLFRRRFIKK